MKKVFLSSFIISLCLTAIVGIFVFLFGDFGEIESKILFTSLIIGMYSLNALCCYTSYQNDRLKSFSIVGITLTIIGAFYFLLIVWGIIDWSLFYSNDNTLRILLTLIILPVFFSYTSLMLLIKNETKLVKIGQRVTITMITILAIMLLMLIYNTGLEDFDFYFRLIGVVSIIGALGTIVTPILNKMYK
jgi:hypothetical protein